MIVVIDDKIYNSEDIPIAVKFYNNEMEDIKSYFEKKHDIVTFAPSGTPPEILRRCSAPLLTPDAKLKDVTIDPKNLDEVFGTKVRGKIPIPMKLPIGMPIGNTIEVDAVVRNDEETVDTPEKEE